MTNNLKLLMNYELPWNQHKKRRMTQPEYCTDQPCQQLGPLKIVFTPCNSESHQMLQVEILNLP